MYNYKKKEGKLDKIKKDRGLEVQKRKSRKGFKKQGIPNPIKKTILVLVWIEDPPMLYYSTLNYELIDRSDIHNIELIQYYQNASPTLEFTGYAFFLSMGLHPELL